MNTVTELNIMDLERLFTEELMGKDISMTVEDSQQDEVLFSESIIGFVAEFDGENIVVLKCGVPIISWHKTDFEEATLEIDEENLCGCTRLIYMKGGKVIYVTEF